MKFLGFDIGATGGTTYVPENRHTAQDAFEFRAPLEPMLDESFVQDVKNTRQQVSLMKRLTKQFANAYAVIRADQSEIAATLAALFKEVKKADLIDQKAANSVLLDEKQFENKQLQESTRHSNRINLANRTHQQTIHQLNQSYQQALGKLTPGEQPEVTTPTTTSSTTKRTRRSNSFFGGLFQW